MTIIFTKTVGNNNAGGLYRVHRLIVCAYEIIIRGQDLIICSNEIIIRAHKLLICQNEITRGPMEIRRPSVSTTFKDLLRNR